MSGAYMNPSKRDDWRTPDSVLGIVRNVFGPGGIGLDPCASADPAHHFAEMNITEEGNGLTAAWGGYGPVFVNPPFGKLDLWARKVADFGFDGRKDGAEAILLLPSRTDTAYWHEHVGRASAVALWRGRIRFVGAKWQAPFPVAFAYYGPARLRFERAFREYAMVIVP